MDLFDILSQLYNNQGNQGDMQAQDSTDLTLSHQLSVMKYLALLSNNIVGSWNLALLCPKYQELEEDPKREEEASTGSEESSSVLKYGHCRSGVRRSSIEINQDIVTLSVPTKTE